MDTPLRLEIQGFEPSAHVRDLIDANLRKFEERCGRVTSCNVTIRAAGAHHRQGEPYAVSIHLAFPNNREVSVKRVSKGLDRRHSDVSFAINDAFRRAMRQIRDKTRQLQGSVKTHAELPVGRITSLKPESESGTLESADGREIYFHANSVLDGRFGRLAVGDRVFFHEEAGIKGAQASTVRLLRPSSKHRSQRAAI